LIPCTQMFLFDSQGTDILESSQIKI
jgi:hypothetical protein